MLISRFRTHLAARQPYAVCVYVLSKLIHDGSIAQTSLGVMAKHLDLALSAEPVLSTVEKLWFMLDVLVHCPRFFQPCLVQEFLLKALLFIPADADRLIALLNAAESPQLPTARRYQYLVALADVAVVLNLPVWLPDQGAALMDGLQLLPLEDRTRSIVTTRTMEVAASASVDATGPLDDVSLAPRVLAPETIEISGALPAVGAGIVAIRSTVVERVPESQAEGVIMHIRRSLIPWMYMEMSVEVKEAQLKMQETLQNALTELSAGLYNEDAHLFLELTQNADDNAYDHDAPALQFVLTPTTVFVLNNEVGFAEDNIRAVCDVGKSTKKTKYGYIGNKGIGFKSVFRITHHPEIHSNGFHFKFDSESQGQLGYILPSWVPSEDQDRRMTELMAANPFIRPNSTLEEWRTRLILPLKDSSFTEFVKQRKNLEDVKPALLLFLRRLRCIIVTVNHQTDAPFRREMRRVDLSPYLVAIDVRDQNLSSAAMAKSAAVNNRSDDDDCSNDKDERRLKKYLLVRYVYCNRCIFRITEIEQFFADFAFQVRRSFLPVLKRDAKREGNAPTEIVLAFPLYHSESDSSSLLQEFPDQDVYAFLPLRSFRFKFIVQADWMVPSSREDVDKNSEWNKVWKLKLCVH
jgi:hypothetical protein